MIGIFNTLEINGTEILRPSNFQLTREDVYAGEYTSCTGRVFADRIGWRYADTTISWDTLPDDQLSVLTSATGTGTITFTDSDGEYTEQFIRDGFANTPTRATWGDGTTIWKGVSMKVRFINVHSDE